MSSDGNHHAAGAPAAQSGGPTKPNTIPRGTGALDTGPVADTQGGAYAEAGVSSFVDQFNALGLGPPYAVPGYTAVPHMGHAGQAGYAGHPGHAGPPLVAHPGPYYPQYAPNYMVPDSNGTVWSQDGLKWAAAAYNPNGVHDYAALQVQLQKNQMEYAEMHRTQMFKSQHDGLGSLNAELPRLENRRSSSSTMESTPTTPYYGSTAARDAGRVTIHDRGSSAYTTPSPAQLSAAGYVVKGYSALPHPVDRAPIDRELKRILEIEPAIPPAVPAVFTPRENMKTVEQSLVNPIPGNRNVYIRGLGPTTDDNLLLKYTERFGRVETSKAIIETGNGACKGFGFAKFRDIHNSESCIRGFHAMGYEVGFARVRTASELAELCKIMILSLSPASADASAPLGPLGIIDQEEPHDLDTHKELPKAVKTCGCPCKLHTDQFTNFPPWDQESFNSRLKAEGDESSTNLYISNLPKSVTETMLNAIFCDYTILSAKILRDPLGNSRGVGFARFESREICDEVIETFTGRQIGEEGLPMQIRYADTPAQKELKRVTTERRQFRTNEYNVGAYGTPLVGMSPTIYSQPGWKQRGISSGPTQQLGGGKIGAGGLLSSSVIAGGSPSSETNSADEGATVHIDSPLKAHGSTRSSPAKKDKN